MPGRLPAQFHHMGKFLLCLLHKKRNQLHVKLQSNHLRQQKSVDFLLPKHIFLVGQVALPGLVLQQIVQGAVQYLRDTV